MQISRRFVPLLDLLLYVSCIALIISLPIVEGINTISDHQTNTRRHTDSVSTTKDNLDLQSSITSRNNGSRQAVGRILNGTQAPEGKYPYIVYFPNCLFSGTLIRSDWVLSGARITACVAIGDDVNIGGIKFDSGEKNVVQDIIIHPAYNDSSRKNDIALIKLKQNSTSPRVKLNLQRSIPATGREIDVAAFGMQGGFIYSEYLQEITIQTLSKSFCEQTYKDYVLNVDGRTQLCGGIPDIGGKGVCFADQGGPAVLTGRNGTNALQVGIISWHRGCGLQPTNPSVFTRVSTYQKFIMDTIKNYGSM